MYRSVLLSTLAFVAVVFATQSLVVELSGPSDAVGVDGLKVFTTITNTGSETLKLLNDPHSPLSRLPVDLFTITNEHGKNPDFIGIKVSSAYSQYSRSYALILTILTGKIRTLGCTSFEQKLSFHHPDSRAVSQSRACLYVQSGFMHGDCP